MLSRDASPLVSSAAQRTLAAWAKAEPVKGHFVQKPTGGTKPWWAEAPDAKENSFRISEQPYPGKPNKQVMGGLVYDSLNREMILIGGVSKSTGAMPTCLYDRVKDAWIDLDAQNLGSMGVGQDTCVFDPEHNVVLEVIRGVAYRYKDVPLGTRAFYGGSIGQKE